MQNSVKMKQIRHRLIFECMAEHTILFELLQHCASIALAFRQHNLTGVSVLPPSSNASVLCLCVQKLSPMPAIESQNVTNKLLDTC